MKNIPYERIIAWSAGPLSIVAGYLGTQLTTHIGLFGSLGITKDQTARAIVTVGTFVVGAAVTYAGHNKWLTNLAKYWEAVPAGALPSDTAIENEISTVLQGVTDPQKPESAVTPDPMPSDVTEPDKATDVPPEPAQSPPEPLPPAQSPPPPPTAQPQRRKR